MRVGQTFSLNKIERHGEEMVGKSKNIWKSLCEGRNNNLVPNANLDWVGTHEDEGEDKIKNKEQRERGAKE